MTDKIHGIISMQLYISPSFIHGDKLLQVKQDRMQWKRGIRTI